MSNPVVPSSTPKSASINTQTPPSVAKPAAEEKKPQSNVAAASTSSQSNVTEATNQGADAVKKWKLKVDGREIELPENDLIANAQKGFAADKRFQEAQATRKQNEALIEMLRTNPIQALMNPALGLPKEQVKEIFEKWYKAEYVDPSLLSPEQLKAQQQEQELNRYRDQEKQKQEQEHQARLQQLEAYHAENYQKMFVGALQQEGLPKTEFTIKRMADLTAKSLQMGLDLSAEHLASLVRQDYLNEIKSVLGATDGDVMLNLLGDDIANKLRKADLARLRAGQPQVPRPVVETPRNDAPESKRKYKTMDEVKAERDRIASEMQKQWRKG